MAQEAAVPAPQVEETRPRVSALRRAGRLALRHPLGAFGLLAFSVFVITGVFANLLAPYSPTQPIRVSANLGNLVEPVGADDTELVFSNLVLGTGGSAFLEEEKIIILFVDKDDTTGLYNATVQRGTADTEAAPHEAGARFGLEDFILKLDSPSWDHPFGTDVRGRDVLSRTLYGARISLLIGVVSIAFGVTIGTLFGVVSGYFGKFVDMLIQRIVDMFLAFPAVVLLLAIITVFGDEDSSVRRFLANNTPVPEGEFLGVPVFLDVFIVSLGIGIAIAVGTARIVRGAVLSLKENVYIDAAHAMGASDMRIMIRHIFPNVAALVVVLASIFLPIAILAEAAISFLGIGVPEPTPSWGADLSGDNQSAALEGKWWPAFFPGLALSIVVLGFNLLGDTFRDISDPRLRGGLGGPGGGGGSGRGGGSGI